MATWHTGPDLEPLRTRLAAWRSRALRCLAVAVVLEPEADGRCLHQEELALLFYERRVGNLPFHKPPVGNDLVHRQFTPCSGACCGFNGLHVVAWDVWS